MFPSFFPPFQNLRNLTALSVADMGPMPMDMLFSFDQLKVLNLSGNHLKNTLLTLIDPIGSLEVSRWKMKCCCQSLTSFLHIYRKKNRLRAEKVKQTKTCCNVLADGRHKLIIRQLATGNVFIFVEEEKFN